MVGRATAPPDDPAWRPPTDPLDDVDLDTRTRVVRREVPLVTVATGWTVPSARMALSDLVAGRFDAPAQLCDSIIGRDDRVQSALAGRLSLLGRPIEFDIPKKYKDSDAARECRDVFADAWPSMATEPVMAELQRWAIMLGFGVAQILWDTSGVYAIPHPLVWHPRYTYYHWTARRYVAITQDGPDVIFPGDGGWLLHAPAGDYRGWMRGAVGAVAPWWLSKHLALRDWSRWSEREGLQPIKWKHPAQRDPTQDAAMMRQLSGMGQEVVIDLPQHPVPQLCHDVDYLRSNAAESAKGFDALITRCDSIITLAIQSQNLAGGAEVTEGSYAAARVHAGVKQALLESDARALEWTLYQQLARPFATMNGWPADMAPRPIWDVTPYEDAATKALALMQVSMALNSLRLAGFKIKDLRSLVRSIIPGLDIGEVEAVAPLAVQTVTSKGDAAKQDKEARGVLRRIAAGLRIAPQPKRIQVSDAERDAQAEQEALAWQEQFAAASQARREARR